MPEPEKKRSSFALSRADLLFLFLLLSQLAPEQGNRMLTDADIGWHVLDGEYIWAHRAVPTTNFFTAFKHGAPWLAWEWLFDLAAAAAHHYWQLAGVVFLAALTYATIQALVFRVLVRRAGNVVVALGLVSLTCILGLTHLYTRPHLFGWLFTVVFYAAFDRLQRGEDVRLGWLIPVAILWTNIHPSFPTMFVVLGIFLAGNGYTWLRGEAEDAAHAREICVRLGKLALVLLPCTLVNPYGVRLHAFIYSFLHDPYVADHMQEFESPSLHDPRGLTFALFALACVLLLARRGARPVDALTAIYAAMGGLYSFRNMPVSTILLAFAVAPYARSFVEAAQSNGIRKMIAYGDRTAPDELRVRGIPLWRFAAVGVIAFFLGRSRDSYHFDSTALPVDAASFIAAHDIHDGLFAPDQWGCFLTYRLFPSLTVLVDDRFELVGKEAMQIAQELQLGNRNWRDRVREFSLTRILLPPKWGMATVLREATDWRVEYEDETAVLFVARAAEHP